ncbi:type VII secretion-associated serine protease mycosin [Streptomyces thermodiastaticus]|uniref:Type VII secretion-associated serine protease mycosin n=1 Tax=Streptomyces thermodiastaticus TaxID=44061 RepID=A0ABU0KMB2_9ACTN|nr:type VII secretion-associated serine protease mycosin [Streptomyces thermodiastaticus]UVT12107.1 type VII secretion-associated serine protease mycosin [Streptomyces thermocarboxydus]WSB43878.1 type VII secretion-associated serine protease mycosin [Streptomyces cellulosae]WTF22882.1 type VII secretion-associated serine protease mycosin [Streptomyces cellulosae]
MRTCSKRTRRPLSWASATLGLLLVGVAATPAHAESVRSMQWHLDVMRADEMWKVSKGRGVTVAVIDSGVDDSLTDLKGQVLDGKDYSKQRGDEHTDIEGHGTRMAALIAATGARGPLYGSYGLAPEAKILPIRTRYATEDFGQVDGNAEYSRVLSRAIRYAAGTDAQIINISMGNPNTPGRENVGTPQLASAVRYAIDKGKLIFAAAGNNGDASNLLEYPAATPGVVGVGAVDRDGKVLSSSQRGPQVDFTAPGSDMVNACLAGTQVCKGGEGTSSATALASASAALIWSQHPDWTNHQVLRVMLNTAGKPESGDERTDAVGYGMVRPRIALKNPGDPGPADEYPLPDLAAAASAPPSTEKPSSTDADDGTAATEKAEPAASAADDSDDSGVPWVAMGMGAAALLAAAVAVSAVRARRRRPAPAPAAPPFPPSAYPYAPQQPPPPYGPPPGHTNPPPPMAGSDQSRHL